MGLQLSKVIVTCVEVVDKSPMVSGMGYGFSGFLALVFGGGYFSGPFHSERVDLRT